MSDEDPALAELLAELALGCDACPDCQTLPCAGCMQGAACDGLCWCDRDDEVVVPSEDEP